ncbi:hypothetical protein BD309DRAFT_962527 [Dichomitus squalens]|uniref:Uncharacterized protein n=1 Tax=Dichomitus squalens TaxID=114155 RepID=A0A4V6MWM4_9APHY|nr:hypothetical protein BD309DRAFT_962527 [Dichomitus squalens]TBU52903.1 hypothetical protein BD310DRAFT_939134 [Dichomitus squalens]
MTVKCTVCYAWGALPTKIAPDQEPSAETSDSSALVHTWPKVYAAWHCIENPAHICIARLGIDDTADKPLTQDTTFTPVRERMMIHE